MQRAGENLLVNVAVVFKKQFKTPMNENMILNFVRNEAAFIRKAVLVEKLEKICSIIDFRIKLLQERLNNIQKPIIETNWKENGKLPFEFLKAELKRKPTNKNCKILKEIQNSWLYTSEKEDIIPQQKEI
jgi:hypothetical protein